MKSYCHIYAQFDQLSDDIAGEMQHLFDLGLVCDTSFKLRDGAGKRNILADLRARGGLTAPSVYPADCDPACPDANWWKYSKEECVRLLRKAQKDYEALDLGPLDAINTYTPGNGLVAACRELGIRHILGFCAPIIIEDGDWNISHYGSPLSPYFVGEEDYRKPENPGARPDSVLICSMELRNPLICLRHWGQGAWTPISTLCADRSLEPGGEPLPFYAAAEDWLRTTELTGEPRFFHVNLEYFFCGKCREFNRQALEWLAAQRDRGRLEIGSIQPWAARMLAKGGFLKQTTYWRGEMMGFHVGHRAGSVADVIVAEDLPGQVLWEYPDPRPQCWYDYTTHWDYPAYEPNGTAPAPKNLPAISVETQLLEESSSDALFRVTVTNSGPAQVLPLALWDLLPDRTGPFQVECREEWQAEVLPHPAGVGGAVLLKGLYPSGTTTTQVRVTFSGGASGDQFRRSWGSLLEAQTFYHRERPYTVLVSQVPDRFSVVASVVLPQGKPPVRIESLCGIEHQQRALPAGGLPLLFDGSRLACWHRFWDITADQLKIEGVEEVEDRLRKASATLAGQAAPGLIVPEPGYQRFGDIMNPSRWDRTVGRAMGEAEVRRMNEWFQASISPEEEIVVEVHPGIYLPRGSITKALGREFNELQCAKGYGFNDLCVDYPQAWDWGVSAWVQWRYLKLSLDGLSDQPGAYTLHLHAFDPEGRDISQRIHFFEPGSKRPDYCMSRDWPLPKGLEGRWEKSALRSIAVPQECLQWKSLGLWISPLEKIKWYDWIAEKGAPGMISHLWLTRKKDTPLPLGKQ